MPRGTTGIVWSNHPFTRRTLGPTLGIFPPRSNDPFWRSHPAQSSRRPSKLSNPYTGRAPHRLAIQLTDSPFQTPNSAIVPWVATLESAWPQRSSRLSNWRAVCIRASAYSAHSTEVLLWTSRSTDVPSIREWA